METFYVIRAADGSVHIQQTVDGILGHHSAHTPEGFEAWRDGDDVLDPIGPGSIVELVGETACGCGLRAGEFRCDAPSPACCSVFSPYRR